MTRIFIAALLCVSQAFGAQYNIKLNPGDTVLVEAVTVTTPPVEPVAATIPLGVNLPGMDDWNAGARAKIFVDVMKTARCIQGAVGPDGWPTGASKWRVLTTSNNQAQELNWSTSGSRQPKIAGTYLLSWDGTHSAVATAAGAQIKNYAYATGRHTADLVIAADNVDIDLNFSAPVKNIVLLRPGYPRGTTQFVTNEFKAYIAPFTTIRFMDAMATNWADEADAAERFKSLGADKKMNWAERPSDSYATYNRPWGLSVEAAIRVANETKCNPWIPIPWCATDDMVSGLLAYEKANLDPALTATHEWGNELWNYAYGFHHSGLFRDEAKAYAAAGTLPKLANPPDNDYYYAMRYAALRTIRAAEIARAQGFSNVKFVLSGQFANPSFTADPLNWALRSYPSPPNYYLSGIACAPYIGAGTGTPDQIIAALNADIATRQATDSKLMWWRAMADQNQMKLYMYEAGVDMGQGTTNLTNKIATAYDARMSGVVKSYLESCYFDAGTESLMYFQGIGTRDKWGPAWALTDDAVDLTQPMYAGAKVFTATAPATSGLTATFYKDSNFTTALGTITIPCFNHRWQAWATGGIWGRKDMISTQAADGSIRVTGRYLGAGTLTVEKEANDVATLITKPDGTFTLDYKAIFGGNGIAWGRLVANGKPVPAGKFSLN